MRWHIIDKIKHKEVTPRRNLQGEELKDFVKFYFFKHYDLEFVQLYVDRKNKTAIISLRKENK